METDEVQKGCLSLTELVVGVIIIVTVLILLVPAFESELCDRSARTEALAHAKQIHIAVAEHAIDHDGLFPTAEYDSNEAFRQLFNRRFESEMPFYVPGCAWHGGRKPDNVIGDPPDYAKALEPGENHWAYVTGLNNGSKGNLPLIADGFTADPGTYCNDPEELGGVWEGEAAIVIRVDGSGKLEKPSESDGRLSESRKDGGSVDLFSEDYFRSAPEILNPAER